MSINVRIGTCGFGRIRKPRYADGLSAVEIQHTFYHPPSVETLEGWRAEMPEGFEFTLKAWQLITHDAKSPTYRRFDRPLTETEREEAGYFRPTATVREGWEVTLASAKALGAKTVLFQCPASFRPAMENIANLEEFFGTADRGGLNFAWEPRGNWAADTIREISERHYVCHAVDPFATATTTPEKCYFRLHGRTGYNYKYEEDELADLAELLPRDRVSYVFFNNRYMFEDAVQFKKIIGL